MNIIKLTEQDLTKLVGLIKEEPLCGDKRNKPCENSQCPKSAGATWQPTYVTNSCNCKTPSGYHCGSVAPGLEPTDVWSGTEYEDDVMSSGYEETGIRRSDNDRLRRRPTSAKARFRAGLGNSL